MFKKTLACLAFGLVFAGGACAQNWDETADGGGDSGIQNVAQVTMGAGLTTISGTLNQAGGDHVDCYQITVNDAATFYATSDPAINPAAVVGETDTRMWIWNASGTTIISGNDDTPGAPGLLSYVANNTDPLYTATPTNPVTTPLVNGQQYVICYSYFANDPEDAGNVDLVNMGTFEALNGPVPAAGAFDHYEDTGSDAAAAYTIALRGAGPAMGSSADLAITKTNGTSTVEPNGTTTYTIVASNSGPDGATGATVADTFAAVLNCAWNCVGAGGGTCAATGAGNINELVNLPAGGSTTFTAVCAISPAATGTLVNTATITVPAGTTDPNSMNNSATDTDTVLPPGNLTITPTSLAFGDVSVGQSSTILSVTLGNNGGSTLQVIALTPAAAPFASPGGSCGPTPISIPAAGSCTVSYQFSPAATGAANQVLDVTANSSGSGTITLGGNGVMGMIGVLNANLDFGTLALGNSAQLSLTILNTGDGPLQVTNISTPAAPFSQDAGGSCGATPFSIAVGGDCTVLYSFSPTVVGVFAEPVLVTSDGGTITANLSGTGAEGLVVARELPTLSQLAIAILALLLVAFGATTLRARRQ